MMAQLSCGPAVVEDMRRIVFALALLTAAAVPTAARGDETIATLGHVSPLRASGDVVVWSTRTPHGYQLTMRRGGHVTPVPVAERERAGGFDIGTDALGRPLLAYTRCRRSCDLYTATLDGKERKMAAASSPREDEAHPAVSEGRLAWVRGRRVYTRRLSDPKRTPSRRLYVMGRRVCYRGGGCERIRARSLDDLDVSGARVAFLGSFEIVDGNLGFLIRSVDAHTGRVTKVRDQGTGESGQFLYGLGFYSGRLGIGLSCGGDPGGCGAGAFRYRGTRREATSDVNQAIGFTLSGPNDAYVLMGTRGDSEVDDRCPCVLTHRTGMTWR
jgi:hypothetical protein